MSGAHGTLCINSFYPETKLNITEIQEYEKQILIRMKSISKDCRCPKCGCITDNYHGTYIRKVQDLPILGKRVQLEICSHEYECINDDCEVTTFLNTYSRMKERCADFICTLAMESSCEGCARICKALGIKISGNTVIRLLLRKYEVLPGPEVGDVIGVDDFAYKKRHTHRTIIVSEENHEPIALSDGRNGDTLRDWLRNNKHIKVVTRDRASAYAKVISEKLPDTIQVADRFHLHQNLLEAIKKALNHEVPATVNIPHAEQSAVIEETCKKNRI